MDGFFHYSCPMDISKILAKPISPTNLGLFRIIFGVVMLIQLVRLQPYINETLTQSLFFLTYPGFNWITITSPENLKLIFTGGYVGSILLALGVFSRWVAGFLFITWGYLFLLDSGHYNNHYYLILLLLLLFTVTNADAAFPVLKKKRKDTIPYWQLFLFKFQIVLVYFYGGLAKFNMDWLNAAPMKIWLSMKPYEWLQSDAISYFICWSGLIFDLAIGFLLWNRKTRLLAICLLVPFHLFNHFIWQIGVFPWLMILATVLFIEPEKLNALLKRKEAKTKSTALSFPTLAKTFVMVYIAFQLLFPLRQRLYQGYSFWNGYGFRFAWNMMLYDNLEDFRIKVSVPGEGVVGYIELERYMNKRQIRKFNQCPQNLTRLGHFLAGEMKNNAGIANPELNALVLRSINGRAYQHFIDTTVNMATAEYSAFKVADWIIPFKDTEYITTSATEDIDELY